MIAGSAKGGVIFGFRIFFEVIFKLATTGRIKKFASKYLQDLSAHRPCLGVIYERRRTKLIKAFSKRGRADHFFCRGRSFKFRNGGDIDHEFIPEKAACRRIWAWFHNRGAEKR